MSYSTAAHPPTALLPSINTQLGQATSSAPTKRTKISPGASLFAGSVAGAVEAAATYPFEFVKTHAQLDSSVRGTSNPLAIIAKVARTDGVPALYVGCTTLIVGTAFKAGVRFLSFDTFRNKLADENGVLSPGRGIIAGMLAGTFESIVAVTPTERIKTALIDDSKSGTRAYKGGFDAFRNILATQGIPGLYRGLISTTIKQSATSAVRMGSYNVLKEFSRQHNLPQNSIVSFGTGAIAGTITVYATQPFDTIKTQVQSARGSTAVQACREILGNTGLRGLWRGSTMRLGRLVLSGGIVFTVYEQVASCFKKTSY